MSKQTKLVTAKDLRLGDNVISIHYADGLITSGAERVEEITDTYIKLSWRFDHSDIDIFQLKPDMRFEVELSRKELCAKYFDKIAPMYEAVHNRLLPEQMGYHEMFNGWVQYDVLDLICECECRDYQIMGTSSDVTPHVLFTGEVCHIGICAYDKTNEEKFWCHVTDKFFDYFDTSIEEYEKLMGRKIP